MVKMVWLISLLSLLVCSTAKAQELIPLHDPTVSTPPLNGGQAVAVQVETEHLMNVSGSVLTAETWLRNYVLPFYPSTNVTTILVGHSLLCDGDQKQLLPFIPPALKNIHHSLTRWGLQNHIKPTTSFSSACLNPDSVLAQNHLKPLLTVLQEIGSPNYMVISSPRTDKPTSRMLLSSIGLSPLPPLLGTISPAASDALPPSGAHHLPPCEPWRGAPPAHQHHGLWCVAKPSVPPETLQEALDFACGEGGADCEAIGQDGSCYYPDTVNAHASYAFNSYWQKNKKSGGSCGFGGTAMLIASDPSYSHCRFTLA